jgi:hypothetical protein
MAACPHCQYPLTEPPPRYCPSCGRDLEAAAGWDPSDLVPPPLPSGSGAAAGTPWERRRTIGFGAGLFETVQQVLTSPEAFYRQMPVTGGIGDPLFYGVLVSYIGLVAASIYNAVFNVAFGSAFAGLGEHPEFARFLPFVQGGAGLVVNLIMGPVFIVVGLFVWSGIVHVILLLLGGAGRGFEATFRVVAYGATTNLIQIVPFCGGLIGAIYGIVLAIIGLSAAHGDSKGKTAAAVLAPLVLCCCCIAVAVVVIMGGVASIVNQNR